jgi:5'-nucleotidase
MDFRYGDDFDFGHAARFVAGIVTELDDLPLADGTLLNVNCPAGDARGVQVTRLGKRIYRDELTLSDPEGEHDPSRARKRYWVYGRDHGFHDEPGTDLCAVAAGDIAVTPLHFDLTDATGLDALERHDLSRLLAPAAEEVE